MAVTVEAIPVHPHACGEHFVMAAVIELLGGSPPRMWGTRPQRLPPPAAARFTPTHVGNTRRQYSAGPGSPPRMWGTR